MSRDTVEAAYGQLHVEGFILRRVGSGSFVSERAQYAPGRGAALRASPQKAALRLSQRGSAMFQDGGVREFLAPRAFAPGVPETRSFPLPTWERLTRQVLKNMARRRCCTARRRAWNRCAGPSPTTSTWNAARAPPERVLVLTSSQQALTLCATVLLDAGEQICIEDPVYHGARKAFAAAGLECVPVPLDADGMRVERLDDPALSARAVYLTPSHQFPTGATLALERRLAVIDWARRRQAWIIEDDYDSEFHYAGKPTACVQGLDPQERTIYIGTFTKSLFPGLRIGYMVLPAALVAPMTAARTLLDGHSAPIPQLTLARFIDGGHFGARTCAPCAPSAGGATCWRGWWTGTCRIGCRRACRPAACRCPACWRRACPSARRWTRRGGKG